MTATSAAFQDTPATLVKKVIRPKVVTPDAYFKKYRDLEDGFKYELVDGSVEKTPRTMNPAQSFILRNLHHRFIQTKVYAEGGDIQVEIEMETKPGQIRKPDICYRSAQQIASGDFSPSTFVVEIMSANDKINRVKKKLREYFAAGVQVVWHIYSDEKEIEVFTSPRRSEVFVGEETVTAAPAIPDFTMKVEDVFKKPVVSE